MFYSRTILAKKSPLGTVWIAAHLEQRIKKTQIEGIDIPSYADCIMFPEVPIALRLSGHLLLGLVRIYSRKVNYLYQDCNRMVTDIRTVFTSIRVDLPIDADRAPFETITKPDTFDLDAMELDDSIDLTDGQDKHLKTYDQITIGDQNPVEAEPYVTILINEDDRLDIANGPDNFGSGAAVIEEDVFPPFDGTLEDFARPLENVPENVPDVGDPGPSNPGGVSVQNLNESSFSYEFPEIEVMRDAVHTTEAENLPELSDTLSHNLELHEQSAPSMNRREILSPIMEGPSVSGGASPSLPVHDIAPSASVDELDILNTGISPGHQFPDVELQPSPPVRRRRAKRRKEEIDPEIVLSNVEMRKQLEDASKLVCKRRKLPDTVLDLWRYARTRDCTFIAPLISGMSDNLQEVFKRSYPSSTPESASVEVSPPPLDVPEMEPTVPDTVMEPAIPEPEMEPATHETEMETARDNLDMEPEIPRFGGNNDGVHCDLLTSPSTGGEFTPLTAKNLGSASERGNTFETEVLPTLDIPASETVGPALETPSFNWGEQLHMDDTDPGRNYNLLNSGDVEELNFLEASNASSGCDVIKVESMSARTRAVAQYLKEHSPASQTSEEQPGFLNLNKILERKTRRQCARMFFETLVLKSCHLIDVKQEEAYGDILISPTPDLLSAKF